MEIVALIFASAYILGGVWGLIEQRIAYRRLLREGNRDA